MATAKPLLSKGQAFTQATNRKAAVMKGQAFTQATNRS
jgi:hypothetical protein